MRFVKLVNNADRKPVYINVNAIAAIYHYYGKDTTCVSLMAGDCDSFFEVLESPEAIMGLINGVKDD